MEDHDVVSRRPMLFEPRGKKWYEYDLGWNHVDVTDDATDKMERNRELDNKAARLLEKDIEQYKKYQNFKENRSNFGWIGTVLRTGTVADKLAAHTVLIQDSAPHNLGSIESLVKMIDPKGKRECLMAADTLKDVFLADLLPPNRKLKPFLGHPFGALKEISEDDKNTEDSILMLWYFESRLKQLYINFVGALGKMAQDSLAATKKKAIGIILQLLSGHPEQEQMLLRNLVNKVGDPDRKTASQACLCLCKLVNEHPLMKAVVVNEVERLLFRPNVSSKACYYSVCFLNQLILDADDAGLASKLTVMYLAHFKATIKHGEADSKMMSALLTGVNRAFPFVEGNHEQINEQLDTLYKAVQMSTFNVSIQALTLLFHVQRSQSHFNDRFYCSLYRKLIDPLLKNMSKPTMFLNLLYKTLKHDDMEPRVYAFIKRILQIIPEQSPTVMCGLLYVISEILKGRSRKLLTKLKEIELDNEDDEEEEEIFSDLDGEDENLKKTDEVESRKSEKRSVDVSWVHRRNSGHTNDKGNSAMTSTSYDPLHRNPLFAKAERSSAFELLKLSCHYHPTVALFAGTLLSGNIIVYAGDPLQDFTLINFLDRFVFRNPKKPDPGKNMTQWNIFGKSKLYRPVGVRAVPVNQGGFIRNENKVPIDEHFFYNYFTAKKKYAVNTDEVDDDDIVSVASDEFETAMDAFEPEGMKDDFDVDFAHDIKSGASKNAARKKKGKGDESDSGDELDDEPVFDNEFHSAFKEFEKDIAEANCDDDLVEMEDEFADDNDDADFDVIKESSKNKKSKKLDKKKKKKTVKKEKDFLEDDDFSGIKEPKQKKMKTFSKNAFGGMGKYFASADEFASILEENASSNVDTISSQAIVNRDNSDARQIRWEEERDRFVRGVDWKTKRRRMGAQKRGSGPSKRGLNKNFRGRRATNDAKPKRR